MFISPKMLFQRVIILAFIRHIYSSSEINKTDTTYNRKRHINIFADEAKYQVNRTGLSGIANNYSGSSSLQLGTKDNSDQVFNNENNSNELLYYSKRHCNINMQSSNLQTFPTNGGNNNHHDLKLYHEMFTSSHFQDGLKNNLYQKTEKTMGFHTYCKIGSFNTCIETTDIEACTTVNRQKNYSSYDCSSLPYDNAPLNSTVFNNESLNIEHPFAHGYELDILETSISRNHYHISDYTANPTDVGNGNYNKYSKFSNIYSTTTINDKQSPNIIERGIQNQTSGDSDNSLNLQIPLDQIYDATQSNIAPFSDTNISEYKTYPINNVSSDFTVLTDFYIEHFNIDFSGNPNIIEVHDSNAYSDKNGKPYDYLDDYKPRIESQITPHNKIISNGIYTDKIVPEQKRCTLQNVKSITNIETYASLNDKNILTLTSHDFVGITMDKNIKNYSNSTVSVETCHNTNKAHKLEVLKYNKASVLPERTCNAQNPEIAVEQSEKLTINNKEIDRICNYKEFCLLYGIKLMHAKYLNRSLHNYYGISIRRLIRLKYKHIDEISDFLHQNLRSNFNFSTWESIKEDLINITKAYSPGKFCIDITHSPYFDTIDVSKQDNYEKIHLPDYFDFQIKLGKEIISPRETLKTSIKNYLNFVTIACLEYNKKLKLYVLKRGLWGIHSYIAEFNFYIIWKIAKVKEIKFNNNETNNFIVKHLTEEINYLYIIISHYNVIIQSECDNQKESYLLKDVKIKFRTHILNYLKKIHSETTCEALYHLALNSKQRQIEFISSASKTTYEKPFSVESLIHDKYFTCTTELNIRKINQTILKEPRTQQNMLFISAFTFTYTDYPIIKLSRINALSKKHNFCISKTFLYYYTRSAAFQKKFIVNVLDIINFIKYARDDSANNNKSLLIYTNTLQNYIIYAETSNRNCYQLKILSFASAWYFYSEFIRSLMW